MSPPLNEQVFSISREDLLFNFARHFEAIFKFSAFDNEATLSADKVSLTEAPGYNFKSECSPIIELSPLSDEMIKEIKIPKNDLCILITIEDIGLAIRKIIDSISVKDVLEVTTKNINLNDYDDLSFSQGFEVKCYISRRTNIDDENELIWSKSQVIYEKSFIAKTSSEDELFEIAWTRFPDEKDQKDLLYYIFWKSTDVSTEIDTDCFDVRVNERLKDQFNRLEKNQRFGEFCIRVIAEQILRELLCCTLQFSSIDGESPQKDSLHDKFSKFLESMNIDITFDDLARKIQKGSPAEKMETLTEITKISQRYSQLGSTLEQIRFGGQR